MRPKNLDNRTRLQAVKSTICSLHFTTTGKTVSTRLGNCVVNTLFSMLIWKILSKISMVVNDVCNKIYLKLVQICSLSSPLVSLKVVTMSLTNYSHQFYKFPLFTLVFGYLYELSACRITKLKSWNKKFDPSQQSNFLFSCNCTVHEPQIYSNQADLL